MQSVLIVNPKASKVTERLVEQVARTLGVADVVRTERGGHATELVAGLDNVERIYVFSGDGGFNEALNGSDGRVPLGFAAGVGLDAELVRRMDDRGRDESGRRPGDLVFAWTAVKTLAESRLRFEPVLEIEGQGRAAFALVANSDPYSYVGRLPLRLPRGAELDGGLDLLAPRSFSPRSLPGAIRYILTGRTRLPLVHLHDADRIRIRCDVPMPLQLDGEDIGDGTEVLLEAERDAVSVLV